MPLFNFSRSTLFLGNQKIFQTIFFLIIFSPGELDSPHVPSFSVGKTGKFLKFSVSFWSGIGKATISASLIGSVEVSWLEFGKTKFRGFHGKIFNIFSVVLYYKYFMASLN
jgi:hypothetical protein